MNDPPMTRPLRPRTAWWVVSTHITSSLVVALFVLFFGVCVAVASAGILHLTSTLRAPAGLLFMFACFAVAGIAGALHSTAYLRKYVAYPQPNRLVKHCTIWYAAVLLAVLLAIAVRQREWSTRLAIPLLAIPAVACFWWQTRSQFRKWEQEQPQPKSYGFPVTLLNQTLPILPLPVLPIADKAPPLPTR